MPNQSIVSLTPDETLIRQVTKDVSARYVGYVDPEDVTQELRLWWLTNLKYVERYVTEGKEGRTKLTAALKNAAVAYCEGERNSRRVLEEPFTLNATTIRRLLTEASWDEESDAAVTVLAAALKKLSHDDLRVLRLFHTDGLTAAEVATQLGISQRAATDREARAIDRVLLRLDLSSHQGPGARVAVSNARAIAVTANQEENAA